MFSACSTIMLKAISVCAVVVIGLFAFSDFSFAQVQVAPPCLNDRLDPCIACGGSGNDAYCYKETFKAKPFCRKGELKNKDYYFYCSSIMQTQVEQTIEFKPPTGTADFASLICSVTNFISNTILPPVAVMMLLVVGFLFLTSGGAPQKAGVAQKALLFTMAGVALLVLAPGIVVLIGDLFGNTALTTAPDCQSVTTGTIVGALLKTVNWLSWFVALTSVAIGLYSGFLYITARDNPQQIQQAAKVLSYVIIGIAVSILAFSIVTITKQLMGL